MSKRKVRIPVHQEVRFEVLNYDHLILRKRGPVPGPDGGTVEVDQAIEMSPREWKKLKKAVRKARDRKKERRRKQLATIRRPAEVSPFVDLPS